MRNSGQSDGTGALPDLGGVRQVSGKKDARDLRWALVASRFNPDLTEALVRSALDSLRELGAREECITVVWVPGAYEVPAALSRLAAAASGAYAAFIALGCVIEGETPHADLINRQVAQSLADLSRKLAVPVIYEVVAARTREQAAARCLSGRRSRGWYAAEAAVEMARLFETLNEVNHHGR